MTILKVAFVQQYNKLLTQTKEQFQFLLQVVSEHQKISRQLQKYSCTIKDELNDTVFAKGHFVVLNLLP